MAASWRMVCSIAATVVIAGSIVVSPFPGPGRWGAYPALSSLARQPGGEVLARRGFRNVRRGNSRGADGGDTGGAGLRDHGRVLADAVIAAGWAIAGEIGPTGA